MRVCLALLALVSLPTIAIAEPAGKDPKTARRYFPAADPAGESRILLAAAFKPGTDRGLDFAKMDQMPDESEDPGSWRDALGKAIDRGDVIDVLVDAKSGHILTEVDGGGRTCAVFGGASCETSVMYDAKSGLVAVHYDHNGKWQLAIELYRVKQSRDRWARGRTPSAPGPACGMTWTTTSRRPSRRSTARPPRTRKPGRAAIRAGCGSPVT